MKLKKKLDTGEECSINISNLRFKWEWFCKEKSKEKTRGKNYQEIFSERKWQTS